MNKDKISNIINKVYPKITENYNSNAKVELYNDIYTRLDCVSAMGDESVAHAEYDWSENKIYLYAINMTNEEQIIRSLIHECIHSTQSKELFDKYYENGATYDTHPFEIQAENEEINWKKYEL